MPLRPSVLIRIDAAAGLTAGVVMLSLRPLLADLFALPAGLLLFIGLVNVAYGCASLRLALRSDGDRVPYLRAMAGANMAWAVVCAALAVRFAGEASVLGMGQLIGEGVLVGGLGVLEWRAVAASLPPAAS